MPRAGWLVLAALTLAPAAPASKGVIEGTVLDGATHEPLKKAQVTLGGPVPAQPTAVTDASGRFVFRELPPGAYWLNASKSGYNPPHSSIGADSNVQITIAEGEAKRGIEITLAPEAAINGRVLNEDGLGVRNCSVTAAQYGYMQGKRMLRSTSGGSTNNKGEYRIFDLAPGRYFVFARCPARLIAAHPLLPRGDPRTPHDTYLPQFYGGGLDPSTATRLNVAAGANLQNIDFQVRRVAALTLRGSLSASDPEALGGGIGIELMPANRGLRDLWRMNARVVDAAARTFQFSSVIPGSYILAASGMHDKQTWFAQRSVEIGTSPPGPIELTLSSGVDLKGSIQFDSQDQPSLENAQIWLAPLDPSPGLFGRQAQAQINKDGAFTVTGVQPGRWRVMTGIPGYVKSVSLGGQLVDPYGFQIGPGAAGPLRVVMSNKMVEVNVTVTGASTDHPVSVLVYPEQTERFGTGLERVTATGADHVALGPMPPGRYRVLVTDLTNPWPILQRPDLLEALESRTQTLDVPAEGHVNLTAEMVSREDILRAIAEKE